MDAEQRRSAEWGDVMELNTAKQREYMRRILLARMTVLSRNGFFGLLLMHMKFALDPNIGTAATDGERVYFDPKFLDKISDRELVFIMMHEIMHVALRHTSRTGGRDDFLFNIACDIVVNSNILQAAGRDLSSIMLSQYGESMHLTPKGDEGSHYTAEEVYEMFSGLSAARRKQKKGGFKDDHSRWGTADDEALDALWKNRIRDALEACKSRGNGTGRGTIPLGVERKIEELMHPKTDWRVLLNDFVQEEVTDYSFLPPDRRFSDSPFMLPDFNETETTVKNVLFMIDTSASMTKKEITQAYSEIKGAIDQFGGRLEGWLGFFDAEVVPPFPFTDENEFKVIRPKGGGGTDFGVIFDYVRTEMSDKEIASIIILTDGFAPFPEEAATMGIPVLWMFTDDYIKPPWGKVAVME